MAVSFNRMDDGGNMVSFVHLLASSARFKELFAEGMELVEEAAEYLDGPGRTDAKALSKILNTAYSAESMRLTTRLMQIASWLLVRRAVSAGEMTPADASAEQIKVRISAQTMVSAPTIFTQLPARLQELTRRSLRLQRRILHLDSMITTPDHEALPAVAPHGLAQQFARLHSAFGPFG